MTDTPERMPDGSIRMRSTNGGSDLSPAVVRDETTHPGTCEQCQKRPGMARNFGAGWLCDYCAVISTPEPSEPTAPYVGSENIDPALRDELREWQTASAHTFLRFEAALDDNSEHFDTGPALSFEDALRVGGCPVSTPAPSEDEIQRDVVSHPEPSEPTDWRAWKQHLIGCADCTAGDTCEDGHAILGSATPDDAPWLRSVSPPRVEGLPQELLNAIDDARKWGTSWPEGVIITRLADEIARLTRERDAMQSALDALAVAVKPVREHVEQWKGLDADYGARDARDVYILAAPQVNDLLSAITALLDGRTTT